MGTQREQCSRAVRRLASGACLFACLLGQAQALPDLLALGVWLEGSHTVHVGRSQEKLSLVLSHGRCQSGGADFTLRRQAAQAAHRHGLASTLVCALADNPPGLPDHTASFNTAGACEDTQSQRIGGDTLSETVPLPALVPSRVATHSADSPALTGEAHAPPAFLAALRCLRSTLLLV